MRIIGGRDYYDGVMAYGQEDTVFLRTPFDKADVISPDTLSLSSPQNLNWLCSSVRVYTNAACSVIPTVIWFAGKRYGLVRFDDLSSKDPPTTFLNADDLFHAVNERTTKQWKGIPFRKDARIRQALNYIFNKNVNEKDNLWMIKNGVSIAIGQFYNRDKNFYWKFDTDGLKDINFPKILDAFTAYQELSMWVGGVLPKNENGMATISDKDKVAKHGFDKWSFRKMPHKNF